MKSTGIIRKVDELGRVVLPIEIRRSMEIGERDPIEIYVEGERIILRKQQDSCVFCRGTAGLITFAGRNVCAACRRKLREKDREG